MLPAKLKHSIEQTLGAAVLVQEPLGGGCVSPVYRLRLEDGRDVVAKLAPGNSAADQGPRSAALELEAFMLQTLTEAGWPTPLVLSSSGECLLLEFIVHDGRCGKDGEEAAGVLLAALHGRRQPSFGMTRDTVIAGLPQANSCGDLWIPFFAEHRLIAMAREAESAGTLDVTDRRRVERLAEGLDRWLLEPGHPSLLHGDLWGGNILFNDGQVAALIDPACYWGHAEVELAFTTLFSTFGAAFFAAYQRTRPLEDGFFEERRDLYNLYPLLVHTRLFGGQYRASVQRLLSRYGV
ncbi:MAG: fructosamine kinase family protein [Pseudomonadota bacterium]